MMIQANVRVGSIDKKLLGCGSLRHRKPLKLYAGFYT